jgi:hypothetical protein
MEEKIEGCSCQEVISVGASDWSLLDSEQSSVQAIAEALRKFDRIFVAQQLHNILHAIVDSSAMPASFKMGFDPDP